MKPRLSEQVMAKAKQQYGSRTMAHPGALRAGDLIDDRVQPGEGLTIVDRIRQFRRPMSAAELAPILGVSEDVLYRMVRKGKIPQLVIPGSRVTRFDPASIVFWLCKHNPLLNQVQKAS